METQALEPTPPFEIKGAVSPLTVLRLKTTDVAAIEAELWDRVEQVPQMLLNAPVVVDVGEIAAGVGELPFDRLVVALRRCQVVPVGVANVPAELAQRAASAGLGTIPLGKQRRATTVEPIPAPAPAPAPAPKAEAVATMTLKQPVRSGQVVYARGADMVVMAAVNPGSQLLADGHIHVYGPLRGRALAGAAGNTEARIFCQSLAAELVSVAGEYLTADEIPEILRGRPAQVFWKDGRCRVAAL